MKKDQRISSLSEFYEKRYGERNFRFTVEDVDFLDRNEEIEKTIVELTQYTDFRVMEFPDGDEKYFIICKL